MFLGRIFFTLIALAISFPAAAGGSGPGAKGYAGSDKCMECHGGIYKQWRLTPHANMLRDAKKNPEAVAAKVFSGIPFAKEDIRWAIGSHWIQKYLGFVDNDFYVLPRYWNIVEDRWEPAPIAGWREQPSSIYCDGCHSTGFDPVSKSFHEPSIGCEACHGPGERHTATGAAADIVNPDRLSKERRDMICEACHTDGTDKKAGGMFRFPAYYKPGDDLTLFYSDFFAPKPGSKKWYRGSMDYRDRHRMFLFWQSRFYSKSRICDICGFESREAAGKDRDMTRDEYCGTCHGKILERAEEHSRHHPGAVECVDCHTPLVAGGGQRYSIHDHKFDFSGPEPPCAECHGTSDVKGKKEGKHDFRFGRVKLRDTLTMEQACARCHPDGPASGIGEKTKDGED